MKSIEGTKDGRTPSAVELERCAPEELENLYNGHELNLFTIFAKSLKRHDSRRNMRRREKDEKAQRRKSRQED